MKENLVSWAALRLGAGLALVFLSGCIVDRDDDAHAPPVTDGDYIPVKPVAPAGWPEILWPADNPYSPEKDVLGRRLFFDEGLSKGADRACMWCHAPYMAFSDIRAEALSIGTNGGVTARNSPTLTNVAFASVFMHDGRFASLETQALGPLFDHNEMDMTEAEIVSYLQADTAYVRLFHQAFGQGPVTLQGVTKALATYQRTLISDRSPYDRWQAGDTSALSPAARRGEALFRSPRLNCASCHVPPLFTDGAFHNIGLDSPAGDVDSGRAAVTGRASDIGRFKTPTLRNIAVTLPYMHDGRFESLDLVLAHYDEGGKNHPVKDARIRPLGLTPGERADLLAFLEALTDTVFLQLPPYEH